jgi:hypothetical protein
VAVAFREPLVFMAHRNLQPDQARLVAHLAAQVRLLDLRPGGPGADRIARPQRLGPDDEQVQVIHLLVLPRRPHGGPSPAELHLGLVQSAGVDRLRRQKQLIAERPRVGRDRLRVRRRARGAPRQHGDGREQKCPRSAPRP